MASMAGFRSWKKQQTFGGAPLSLRVGKVASDDILGSPPFPATLHTLRKTVELSCEGFFDPSDEMSFLCRSSWGHQLPRLPWHDPLAASTPLNTAARKENKGQQPIAAKRRIFMPAL